VKLRHCSELCGEDFTVTGLQCCDEEIHGLFGLLEQNGTDCIVTRRLSSSDGNAKLKQLQ
jgi:hypothetical protein